MMAGEPILIVDDNAVNLKLARILLVTEGYDVRTATDAEEALAVLSQFRARLILMDLQLPGMDGLELTRRLKAQPATKDTIILAVTAYASVEHRIRALGAGFEAYVAKPVEPSELLAVVGSLAARL